MKIGKGIGVTVKMNHLAVMIHIPAAKAPTSQSDRIVLIGDQT